MWTGFYSHSSALRNESCNDASLFYHWPDPRFLIHIRFDGFHFISDWISFPFPSISFHGRSISFHNVIPFPFHLRRISFRGYFSLLTCVSGKGARQNETCTKLNMWWKTEFILSIFHCKTEFIFFEFIFSEFIFSSLFS